MKKIWSIAKWEFLERLKNRLFLITLIAAPLLVVGIGAAAGLMTETNLSYTKVIGIKINDSQYFKYIANELESHRTNDNQPAFLAVSVNDDNFDKTTDAFLNIDKTNNFIDIKVYRGYSISNTELNQIKNAVQIGIYKSEISGSNLNLPVLRFADDQLNNDQSEIKNFDQIFFTSFAFLFLFVVVVVFSGTNFVRALIEEKTTHINEILLSSSSPKEILFGKYFGLILIGILQTLFWFGISFIFFKNNSILLIQQPNYILLLTYFILGYLLYTSIFLSAGSLVSSETESQQVTTLVSLFLLVPIVISAQILIVPDSILSTIFTYFPLTTAPVMLIKINLLQIPLTEILITISLQFITVFVIMSWSSKYFTRGLTQFEKKRRE
jgi:ABC-2 type transport system permease protein